MSILSSLAMISLLCLISLSTPSSASRRLTGDIVNPELPRNTTCQEAMKNIDKVKVESTTNINPSQVNAKHRMKLMKKERKTKPKNEDHDQYKPEHATKRDKRRQGRTTRAYTKNSAKLENSKFPRVVSWRVPRSKKEVPQTGFNLDYAPPKVHPPTHN